jgi:dolichol-phosphate mannosyltransferase
MFRAYRQAVVKNVTFGDDGHQAVAEMLVRAILLGCNVAEVPAVLHRRAFGSSKAKIVATVKTHLRFQWQILSYRLSLKDPVWLTLHDRTVG